MPLWGTGYPGGNPVSALNIIDLRPGDQFVLLTVTDSVATGTKSIPFARGTSASQSDAGCSFQISGCPNGSIISIQASNGTQEATMTLAALDASFNEVQSIAGNGAYTDVGRAAFYRVQVTTFANGDVPVVIVQR